MIKKMLSDRKGAAIELAILMTAVCMAVTTIVLSAALLQYENKVQAEQRMKENIVLEQIVEMWLEAPSEPVEYKGYLGTGITTGGELTGFEIIKIDEAGNKVGNTVLTSTVGVDGTITSWKKG